ncbi:MAG: hypothetical protein MZV70_67000 [Desulfobacterales bacterium]|nr:hypothetical protein [Desulfobacterales bacterium]
MVGGKAIVVKIVALDQHIALEGKGVPEKQALKEAPVVNTTLIMKHMTATREAEVDLHIHELSTTLQTFEKAEILDYQKEYFLKCLDSAIANGFLKSTAIHGVGNGILRTVVLDLLKNYRGTEILDAPMSKYGVGAIEIRIPHNRTDPVPVISRSTPWPSRPVCRPSPGECIILPEGLHNQV